MIYTETNELCVTRHRDGSVTVELMGPGPDAYTSVHLSAEQAKVLGRELLVPVQLELPL